MKPTDDSLTILPLDGEESVLSIVEGTKVEGTKVG
jgi:hypothetical protein